MGVSSREEQLFIRFLNNLTCMLLDNYTCFTLQNYSAKVFSEYIKQADNLGRLAVLKSQINHNIKLRSIVDKGIEVAFNEG